MQAKEVTRWYRFLLAIALCGTFYLATTSLEIPVARHINDKLEHALAFFLLALLVDFSWPRSGFRAAKVLFLLGYGLGIEITQYFLPYREFSLFDLGADAAGLFLYWLTIPLLKKNLPFSRRWKDG